MLQKVILLTNQIQELQVVIPFYKPILSICCKRFEYNHICIVVAESAWLTPQTKHNANKDHHFCEFVKSGMAKIHPMGTNAQVANIFTKPLSDGQLQYLCQKIMMWWCGRYSGLFARECEKVTMFFYIYRYKWQQGRYTVLCTYVSLKDILNWLVFILKPGVFLK